MAVRNCRAGFSLMEAIIVLLIVMLLSVVGIPYYQSAVEATRMTEVNLVWGNLKRYAADQDLSFKHNRLEQEANQKRLKYYSLEIKCQLPPEEENEEIKPSSAPCWEAEFYLQRPNQSIRYYLATQQNFAQLLCIPLNNAGESFCQSQAAKGFEEKIPFQQKEAYLLHQ